MRRKPRYVLVVRSGAQRSQTVSVTPRSIERSESVPQETIWEIAFFDFSSFGNGRVRHCGDACSERTVSSTTTPAAYPSKHHTNSEEIAGVDSVQVFAHVQSVRIAGQSVRAVYSHGTRTPLIHCEYSKTWP